MYTQCEKKSVSLYNESRVLHRRTGCVIIRQNEAGGRHMAADPKAPIVWEDLTPEEQAHLSAVASHGETLVNETALKDCMNLIHSEYQKAHASASEDDLLALQSRLKEKKGYGQ